MKEVRLEDRLDEAVLFDLTVQEIEANQKCHLQHSDYREDKVIENNQK